MPLAPPLGGGSLGGGPLGGRQPWRPNSATILGATVAAPIGGLNTIDAGASMPATDAILLYNMVAAEYGLRTRLGWSEWCTNLTGSGNNEVRTVLPFTGSSKGGSKDKLFATTNTGIWDVSASSATPTKVLTFGASTGDAGYGNGTVFVNAAGAHFLLYCDETNGYHVYTESTNTWAAVTMGGGGTQISGADPTTFVHVCIWANRVWFTVRDTGYAYYTGIGSLFGAVTQFVFGSKFRAGGDLRGLYNWTQSGGQGVVNSIVGISGGGDVVIYQGTDPAQAASFAIKGVWSLGGGGVPYGRRVATDYGGELLLLSTVGVLPLSQLVAGSSIFDRQQYATAKISNLFNQLAYSGRSLKGWQVRLHPNDNTLLINVPQADSTTIQLAMSLATKGWSQYRDMPTMLSLESWEGDLYFGTTDGRVCKNFGYLDGLTLAAPSVYTPIQWEVLTAFQNLNSQRFKRVQQIRPQIISQGNAPSFATLARYDYDFTELPVVSIAPVNTGAVWDTGVWDTASWGGGYSPTVIPRGGNGAGIAIAIGVRGTATSRTSLVGIDVMFDVGGYL
jgi:hypothetical protein